MAIRYAVASGNWSSTATWNGGTLPTSADDVYANTFTVTIDQSVSVLSLQSGTTTGVTVGGSFTCGISTTITTTASIGIISGSASVALTITAGTVNIYGNLSGNTTGTVNYEAVQASGSSVVNIFGNVIGATVGSGLVLLGASSASISGNITGGSGTAKYAMQVNTSGSLQVTGNITGGAGSSSHGITIVTSTPSLITIVGNLTGGSGSNAGAISCAVPTTLNLTGTITASTTATAVQLSNGIVNSVGTINAAAGFCGLFNTANTINALVTVTGPLNSASAGFNVAVSAYRVRIKTGQTNSWIAWRDDTGTNGNEVRWNTSDISGGNPSAANVRLGTIFGKSNEFTGSLAVPPVSSVASGVPVDNTIGTAAVKLEDIAAVTGAQIVAALSRS